ncbi:MAG: N-acetylmuramoyl-L-alanine amidase [Paracoccaceae bacterium]
MIVIHYTAMASANVALARLCDPAHEVSSHYLITADGVVFHLVDEAQRAWHAGAGAWGACLDINSRSIGIEIANNGRVPFAAAQMDALERLLSGIMQRWAIKPKRVIGHSDMAPMRKSDPGRRFDWHRLARLGLSVWPEIWPEIWPNGAPDPAGFRELAQDFGYHSEVEDVVLLDAFRQRFRPWADGPLDSTDMALIGDLARRFPVDA